MTSESASDVELEIGHVLFIDVVGYSKLLIDDQRELQQQLNQIVRNTERFRAAGAAGKLVRLPVGDGMALVFFTNPEAPVQCALEISEALKEMPHLRVRMGINTGPVSGVADVNDKSNIAGGGINMAQRVMDLGDAGHILLSKRTAEDLAQYRRWEPHLHDLGEIEVKHGAKISIVNLYTGTIGNREVPGKLKQSSRKKSARRQTKRALIAGLLLLAFAISAIVWQQGQRNSPVGPAATDKSIAVLPFENASGNTDTEYLSDGISEALINSLTEVQQLRVIARSTAFRYKGKEMDPQVVGRELKVRAVLMGLVRHVGDRLNVQVDLVDATTGAQLWGQEYERKVADLLSIKQTIAREVTEKLRLRLSGEQQQHLTKRDTTNAEAYQLYLKGNYYASRFTKEGFEKGIGYFEQAIAKDPGYAMAYYGLAYCYHSETDWVYAPRESVPRAKAAVEKALKLDDSLSEAHTVLATIRSQYDWDWSGAEHEFRRAIELKPNNALAHCLFGFHLAGIGRFDESIEEGKRALELDPLYPEVNADFGWSLYFARRYDEAIDHLQKVIDLEPNYWLGHVLLGRCYEQKGMLTEAVAEFEKARQIEDAIPEISAALGHGYAISGRKAEALEIIRKLQERSKKDFVPSYCIATVYLGLGMKEEAIQYLGKAYEEGSFYMIHLGVEPILDSLRNDLRFKDMLKRLKLPE